MGESSPNEKSRNIGKYALIEELGEGTLGRVYRGFDQDLGRAVVVRILCEGIKWDANIEEVFNRECQAIAALQHPNIAAVFEVGKEGTSPYMVMESLGSGTLANLIAQKSGVTVEAKLSIMIQVAEGLGYAHKHRILHLDLDPGKIHLTPGGSVKIRDFAIINTLKNHLPHPVVRWGVPIYLSPEQIQQKKCDERADVFAMGTIFYELVTGVHPFHDPDGNKALDNILLDAPVNTFEEFPDVPPGIWTILRKCLTRNPEERYANVDEFSNDCRALLKSLAEDTRLMLSELYASISALRKAATQPDASESTAALLQEAEALLQPGNEPDYVTLDRLMTRLLEHYPEIQAASATPLPLDPICPQIPTEVIAAERPDPVILTQPAAEEKAPVQENAIIPAPMPAEPAVAEVEEVELSEPPLPLTVEPPTVQGQPSPVVGRPKGFYYRKIPRPAYRYAAILLSVLAIAAAVYILLETDAAASVRKLCSPISDTILNAFSSDSQQQASGISASGSPGKQGAIDQQSEVLLKEAFILADENHLEESKTLIHRILAGNPGYQPAIQALEELKARPNSKSGTSDHPLQKEVRRVSGLIDSNRLQEAKKELDRLERTYPGTAGVNSLRRRLQDRNELKLQEARRAEEEKQRTVLRQKEEQWNRHIAELFSVGKYNEAAGLLSSWAAENPGSIRAQEYSARLHAIQDNLKAYASAFEQGKYSEAISAIRDAESLNPTDPGLAELRRQAETRRAAARAVLTVHRLGPKATLLLNGRPLGKDGEVQNERIPIGTHTLAIRNSGGIIASKMLECSDGQRLELVYDLMTQSIRAMSEPDRGLLATRKAMEEVHRFTLKHDHGLFRGSCTGVLSLDFYDLAYTPREGSHGFRIPTKQLKVRTSGTSVHFYYMSDNSKFQTFEFENSQEMERFKQKWDELRAMMQ